MRSPVLTTVGSSSNVSTRTGPVGASSTAGGWARAAAETRNRTLSAITDVRGVRVVPGMLMVRIMSTC